MIKSKLIGVLITGLTSLVIAGCSNKPVVWTEEQVNTMIPMVRVPSTDKATFAPEYHMKDLDDDGKIDVVYYTSRVICVAEGYQQIAKQKGLSLDNNTVVMTPEMRENLSQMANAQKSFARGYLETQGLLKK